MSGGGEKGRNTALRSKRKEVDNEDAANEDKAMLGEATSLASIRDTINETMTKAMSELENKLFKQLSEFQFNFQQDVKKQLDEMSADINRRMEETAGKIGTASRRLDEAEGRIGEVESLGAEVGEALDLMHKTQLDLKLKITELEGHSRRNNIRIYGIKEGVEGTSMIHYIENLIKTELGDSTGLQELGIERAHRALVSKPAETAPPRSTVVRFLKYTTKENIISAAWKKPIVVEGKRIFFDHDYATGVMEKRRAYLPIKKVLKQEGIRFHTPMTKMRVFLDSGTVTYESADQAAKDLRSKGFAIPQGPENKPRETGRLNTRWEKVKNTRRSERGEYQHRIREKLRGYLHPAEVDTAD